MAKVEIVLNRSGVGELLKSSEMRKVLEERANEIAQRAGEGCEVYVAQTRAVAEVRMDNNSTNMDNNTLLKALR